MENMDFPELTKVVLQKVQELEPENATKIVGYLLLDDYAEQEITQLAFGPDDMTKSFVDNTKQTLKLSPKTITSPPKDKKPIVSSRLPTKFTPFVPSSSRFPASPAPPQPDNAIIDACVPMYEPSTNYNFEFIPFTHMEPSYFHYQPQFLPLDDQIESFNVAYSYFPPNYELMWQPRPHQKSPSIPAMRFCERFREGFCKFGGECKFLHVLHVTDDYIMGLNPPVSNEWVDKDCNIFTHGSIKKLEKELVEILKSQGAVPIPISYLPALYHEKYRKKLQSDGYFTENFMNGNIVRGMDDLLLYMTDTIHTIERPDGELCLILAEDVPKYMKLIDDKYEQDQSFSTSCQIYLMFPPQSLFTHEDVSQYFNNFGPVKSVQIPVKLKRLYGFVTFVYPESVTAVLTKGNPHFIGGMRVLVKPYFNKQACSNRKSEKDLQCSIWSPTDIESGRLSTLRLSEHVNFPMKHKIEEHELSVDPKRKNMWEMESSGSSSNNSFSIHTLVGSSTSEGVCIDCSNKGKSVSTMTCGYEEERFGVLNLPDNPFAFEVSHGDSSIDSPEWEKVSEI